jgi:hypothetical protein
MAKTQGSPRGHNIVVRASLPDDERAQTASLSAYAFSQGGKLLDDRLLEKGEAVLNVTLGAEGTSVRVVVGPRLEGEARSLAELFRRGAVERHLRVDLNAERLAVEIPIQIDQICNSLDLI